MADPQPNAPDAPEPADSLEGALREAFRAQPPESGFGSVLESIAVPLGADPRVSLREPPAELPPVEKPAQEALAGLGSLGRYQVFGEIARGGIGAVLRGRDQDLGRDVALKVLLARHGNNPLAALRFVEEAQISGQLQHPGIVPVYELGKGKDGRPYFAMKLIKGQTLASLLERRNAPGEDGRRLLSVFEQVCHTVAYAHARGVIHRDLKPSNVMVGAFGEVQVVDWGLAKVLPQGGVADDERSARARALPAAIATVRQGTGSAHSEAGTVVGTPPYMAPEQARGEVQCIDERADVFALGAILCEILTGLPPYVGRTAAEARALGLGPARGRSRGRGLLDRGAGPPGPSTRSDGRGRHCDRGGDGALWAGEGGVGGGPVEVGRGTRGRATRRGIRAVAGRRSIDARSRLEADRGPA